MDFYKDGAVLLVNFYNGDTYQGDGNRAAVTETGVSHVYSFTIPNITTDNFKIVRLNPGNLSQRWNQTIKMYQKDAGINNCINLTSWPEGDVPCSWTTYVESLPEPESYTGNLYLIGGACTGQNWDLNNATLLANNGNGIYTITRQINAVTGNSSDGFKFLESANWDPQWRPVPTNAIESLSDGGKAQNVTPGQENIVIKKNPGDPDTKWHLTESGTYTITIDLSDKNNGKMSIQAVSNAPHTGDKFYIMGSHNGWSKNSEDHKMTIVDGKYAYKTYENITGNWDFKVAKEDGTELGWSYFSQSKSNYTCSEVAAAISNIRPDTYNGAKNLTIYWDGVNVYVKVEDATPTPSGVTFDGSEYFFWNTNVSSWGTVLAGKDRTQFLQFKNTTTNATAHTKLAFLWEQTNTGGDVEGILAAKAPSGEWHQVRHCRVNADDWNEGAILGTNEGSTDWIDLQEGNYMYKESGSIKFTTRTAEHFKFFLSGTVALAGGSNEFNPWNGNGTLYTDRITKTLEAGIYKFKINPDMTIYDSRGGVNKWTNEFNWDDLDAANSSDNIDLHDGNNKEIWFELNKRSEVTIACDGNKVTVVAVPAQQYTVTFNTDGGSTIAPIQVSDGSPVAQPADPTKVGYTFVKWQLDGSDYDFNSAVTGNITLNAVWAYKSIESVSLNKSALTFFENSAPQTLTASYLPADVIGVTYNWSVAPAGVVTIDNGVVSVVNPGTATITCTATDQEGRSRFATCAVTVHEGEGCVMEEQAIFSHTILGNSIMGGSASNTLPEQESLNAGMEPTCRKIKMYYGNLTSEFTADDNGIVKAKSGLSDNSDVWYEIKGGTNSDAIDGKFYYLKNVKTGGYITRGEGQFGTNVDWYFYTTITSPTNEKTNLYQFIYTKKDGQENQKRICSVWEYSGMASNKTYGLHRRNQDWADNYKDHCPNPMIVFGRGENQGNSTLNVNFIVIEANASNPDYLSTPIVYNTRSYYRFAQNAAVSMTLDKKLRADDKIVVYCYNPSNDARNGGLYINNNKVADISIPANSENIFEYVTVNANAGKNTIEVRSDDNHFCVASVEVLRSLPVAAQDPMLTWSAPANYYTRLAAGPFTFKASSAKSSGPITYISSDENVATVDADGTVTPKTNGTTIITATIEQYLCFGESSIQYNVVVEPTLQEAIDATLVGNTLTLTHDYSENAVINKAITLDAQGYTIGDLTVEFAGDLTLSSKLIVRDFTICAKAGNTSTPAASGQVRNASELKVNGNAYFLYTVDPSGQVQYGWYDFTVPFPINIVSGIKGIQGGVLKEDFRNGVDYAVMEYFGDKQAQGQYPYKKFSGVMQPKKLYTITLSDYNTLRMQKTADGALVAGDEVTLNEYAGDDINKNWNGVGNGTLHHADAGISGDYIQVYQSGNRTFLTVDKNDYSLVVGSAFMVQETGTMILNQANGNKPLLAPSRYESAPATAIQIASEGKPFSDQLFITASETGGQAYTPGVDVAKAGELGSASVPQIWTNAYNSSLCVHEAQLINGKAQYMLSIYAPVAGAYTLTSKNIPVDYSLYLTQNGMIVSELSDTYTLDLSKGITTEYGLLLTEIYNSPTGIENTQTDKIQTTKIIRNGVLYILHNGKVYNAQGAMVK
ncbi:MAG: InlB B-repeat-containing protein [Paludibacteraceae bacterium]|nr:InlB B-repeat-containing protein [Paludibacteraceae bacterium]